MLEPSSTLSSHSDRELGEEVAGLLSWRWRRIGSPAPLIRTNWILPLPIANHFSAFLPNVGFPLPAAIPWMLRLWTRRSRHWFLSSKSERAPRTSVPNLLGLVLSFFGGERPVSGSGCRTCRGRKKKGFVDSWLDWCSPQRSTAQVWVPVRTCNDVQKPNWATRKDFWTHSRDLWPNYFIYYTCDFVLLTTYIFPFQKWILKAVWQGWFCVFTSPVFIFAEPHRGNKK